MSNFDFVRIVSTFSMPKVEHRELVLKLVLLLFCFTFLHFAVDLFRGVFYQGHCCKLVQYFFLEQFNHPKPPLACTDFSHDFFSKPKQ